MRKLVVAEQNCSVAVHVLYLSLHFVTFKVYAMSKMVFFLKKTEIKNLNNCQVAFIQSLRW